MKIKDIKPYVVWVGFRNQLLIKIETDEGLYGWGESGFSHRESSVLEMANAFRDFLIGRSAFDIGDIWQECYRSHYFEGGRVITAALSAIDIALHDIKGKALGVPVHQLIGGKQRDRIPLFATIASEDAAECIQQINDMKSQGWTCFRLLGDGHFNTQRFDPRASIASTANRLAAIREGVGRTVTLGLEYHHRLSISETVSLLSRLPRGTLDFLEEPIRCENPKSYETLRSMTEVPFAIGEELSSKWDFVPYIEKQLMQFNRLDVCNAGGITEALKISGWSEAHYIDMMPHNPLGPICTAATVHFAAAIPNFTWMEHWERSSTSQGDTEKVFSTEIAEHGGHYNIPESPGLGVDVDEAYIQHLAQRHSEAPHFRRPDGSVTNW